MLEEAVQPQVSINTGSLSCLALVCCDRVPDEVQGVLHPAPYGTANFVVVSNVEYYLPPVARLLACVVVTSDRTCLCYCSVVTRRVRLRTGSVALQALLAE